MMGETYPSPTVTFNVVWRAALKSERLSPRRRLIKRLRAANRHSAINKSTWSTPRRLVKLVLLTLLEWELRLQKTAAFKSCRGEDAPKSEWGVSGHDY